MRFFGSLFAGFLSLLLLLNFSVGIPNPEKDKLLIEVIAYVLERGHFSPKEINDDFSENVFHNYIEGIDGQHRFFLQSDINNFNRYKKELDDQIKASDITFFDLTHKRLMSRIEQVKEFYEELLEKPFDFDKQENIDLNFKEMSYASTLNELKSIWRRRFKFSALDVYYSKMQSEIKKKEEDSTYQIRSKVIIEEEARQKTREDIENSFEVIGEIQRKDWFSIFVNSITLEYDPHSNYFPPEEKERFDQNISGKFEGIGARLQKKNQEVKITEIIAGGPVWKDKLLEAGDIILKVAQKDGEPVEIGSMRLGDAVKLIKGPKGTQVFLTVKRVDGLIEEVVITRDIVEIEESYAKSSLINKNEKLYGLIELPKFYIDFKDNGRRNAASDVKKELEQLKQRNVEGIILDLRNNGGGSLKTVVEMTGFFIDEGPVVQVKSTGGRKEVLKDTDPSIIWDGSLVILVNEFSASASEILAAALQDYKRAIVIGSKQTFGKGTVQNVIDLNRIISGSTHGDLGAVKLTTDKFYRINGGSTQLEGVKSDIVILDRYAYVDLGEKDQENPLTWDQIKPAKYKPWPNQFNYDYALSESRQRLASNSFIKLVDEQAKWVKLQQDDYEYTLNYDVYLNEREENLKVTDQFKTLNDFDSNLSFEWLPEPGIEVNDEIKERRDRWVENLEKDFYINEAVNVLGDLNLNLEASKKVAQNKK